MSYTWAKSVGGGRTLAIPADRPVWFVSDLHLGDGGGSDTFMGKDKLLLELLATVRRERGRLVICGDAVDLLQAHDLTPVIKAHGELLRSLSAMPEDQRVIYIHGNHDDDIKVYIDLLRFEVCERLHVGEDVVALHGHQFDMAMTDLTRAARATHLHHAIERLLATWIRVPLADFYNLGNRVSTWALYRAWQVLKLRNRFLRAVGRSAVAERSERYAAHWIRSDQGSGMDLLPGACAFAAAERVQAVVCGHNHMPGNFVHDGVRFVNTGSWTFGWAQATRYADGTFQVRDLLSGREYHDELYRRLLDGEIDHVDFDRWWRNQYLGWFRFRSGETRGTLQPPSMQAIAATPPASDPR
jgi:UDP-2,3-diacylglucosamine pyrophosphatase LpxH